MAVELVVGLIVVWWLVVPCVVVGLALLRGRAERAVPPVAAASPAAARLCEARFRAPQAAVSRARSALRPLK